METNFWGLRCVWIDLERMKNINGVKLNQRGVEVVKIGKNLVETRKTQV